MSVSRTLTDGDTSSEIYVGLEFLERCVYEIRQVEVSISGVKRARYYQD